MTRPRSRRALGRAGRRRRRPRGGTTLDAGAWEAHCHGHPMLAGDKRRRADRFVPELPMTATGKTLHSQPCEQVKADSAPGRLETREPARRPR